MHRNRAKWPLLCGNSWRVSRAGCRVNPEHSWPSFTMWQNQECPLNTSFSSTLRFLVGSSVAFSYSSNYLTEQLINQWIHERKRKMGKKKKCPGNSWSIVLGMFVTTSPKNIRSQRLWSNGRLIPWRIQEFVQAGGRN